MSPGFWIRLGAIWGFLAVATGAFGAHGLRGRFQELGGRPGGLSADRLQEIFHTGSQYHMYCALAILAVGLLSAVGRGGGGVALQVAGWSFLAGSLVFSGSLYALSSTGLRGLGAITPIGGLIVLVGWAALAVAAGAARPPLP